MKAKQFHKEFKLGILRCSIFILKKKFCFRIEIANGWE